MPTNVIVSDTLANLVSTGGFRSAVPSQGTCTPNAVTNGTPQTLSCNLGTLILNASATVTVVVRPSIATSGNRTNNASVRSTDIGDPNIGDPVLTNNNGSVTSAVTAIADITVSKTATPLTVPAGAPLTFVATVHNNGPSTAQTVSLTDTLPVNASFVAVTNITGGGTCGTVPVAGAVGGSLVCSWVSIANNSQFTVTYQLRPLNSAVGGNVVNSVAVTTVTTDSNLANNSATTSTPVTAAQLDILINKVDSVDPVDLGQSTVYTITVNNSGPSAGTNVVMTDVFPAPGSTPTATFSYQGGLTVNAGGVCVEPAIGVISGTLTCTFPGLSSGQTATVTYAMRAESLTISGATSGTAFNAANVTVNETETLLANNAVTHDTTARRFSVITDLAITKTVASGTLVAGHQIDYTLTVVNNGPVASNGAQVIDVLPAGVSFVAAANCVHLAGTVTCPVGPLAVNASRVFTLSVLVNSPYNGATPLLNTAIVDAPGDPILPNNTFTVSLQPPPPPVTVMPVPTMSEWAMALMAGLMLLLGMLKMPRRRV
ncbi:MAG: IPTL-CTERM sorting domain-containing protein [Pseudomonadota bacterium]